MGGFFAYVRRKRDNSENYGVNMDKNEMAAAITQAITEQWQGNRVIELVAKIMGEKSADNRHPDADIAAFDTQVAEETGEEPIGKSPRGRKKAKAKAE